MKCFLDISNFLGDIFSLYHSVVFLCVWLFATPWIVAHQSPLSMEFSRPEYWTGLPFPSLGDLPDPGIKPWSPALQADSLSLPPGKPQMNFIIFFPFIFISWRLITSQYCSGFCHTLTWISHGFTCIPHPDPPSHLPLHPIPLGLRSAPGPGTCLMHPTRAGDLFHHR